MSSCPGYGEQPKLGSKDMRESSTAAQAGTRSSARLDDQRERPKMPRLRLAEEVPWVSGRGRQPVCAWSG